MPDLRLNLSREFNAPIGLVYKMWTEPEYFKHWWGPKGSSLPYCKMDVQVGGYFHYCHRLSSKEEIWIKGVYKEIVPKQRIVFTSYFSDPEGNKVERLGFPLEMKITVHFTTEDQNTKIEIEHEGLNIDQGESKGWREALDRLAEFLRRLQEDP